jgi:hypothetical protein
MRKMGLKQQFTKADGKVVEDEQLDELSPKKYTDAGNARVAQAREIDNISLRGTGHAPHRPGDKFNARDFPENTPQGKLAQRADKLLKHGEKKAIDAEKKSHVSPATARAIGLSEYDAIKKPVEQKPKNPSPTASKTTPGQKLGQTTDIWDAKKTKGDFTQMEDAEFQSFMETLQYVMRHK